MVRILKAHSFRLLKSFPRFGVFFKTAYTLTILRIARDKRYYRYLLRNHLRKLGGLVLSKKMTGGQITNDGEFFLRMPEDIYLFYNVNADGYTIGDGQGLDFQEMLGRGKGMEVLRALISDGDSYFDIGANNGYYYALRIAKTFPNTHVFAFEPNPKILLHLSKNVSFNRLNNIQIIAYALSDNVGLAQFAYELGAGSHILKKKDDKSKQTIKVPTTTLDTYVKTNAIGSVDVIKIDIEGEEYNFLKGAESTLKTFSPILIIELRENLLNRNKVSVETVLDFLNAANYECFKIDGMFDVLCVHKTKIDVMKKFSPLSFHSLNKSVVL